jgi:hypothetical protein
VNLRDRVVANGLLFGHGSQIPAGVPGGQSKSVKQGWWILVPDAHDFVGSQMMSFAGTPQMTSTHSDPLVHTRSAPEQSADKTSSVQVPARVLQQEPLCSAAQAAAPVIVLRHTSSDVQNNPPGLVIGTTQTPPVKLGSQSALVLHT